MVDEVSQDVASEPAGGASKSVGGAPVNRDKHSDSGVIEGELASGNDGETAPPAEEAGGAAPPAQDEGEGPPPAQDSGGPAPPVQEGGETAPPAQDADRPAPSVQQAGDATPPAREAQAGRSSTRRPSALAGFLWGAIGGLVVSAIVAGVGYSLFAPKADLAEANANRLAAIESQAQRIESQAQREDAAISGLDQRVGALEGSSSEAAIAAVDKHVGALQVANDAIDKRLGALQAANDAIDKRLGELQAASDAVDKRLGELQSGNGDEAPRIASTMQAVQTLTGQVKDLRSDVNAAQSEIPSLEARVAKLESGPPQAVAADLSAATARLDKIEAQFAATKNETRVAIEKASASDNPAAVAILAESVRDKLDRGAPFQTDLTGLERLRVEPAKLAPLKAVVDGAPSDSALAADFEAVRSKVLAAAAPTEGSGGPPGAQGGATEASSRLVDRLLAHLRDLVRVRKLNEAPGQGPQALASAIEADSRRGDLSGALAAFAKLPEPSRQAASAWASAAEQRLAAEAAIQSIREAAVAQLANSGEP